MHKFSKTTALFICATTIATSISVAPAIAQTTEAKKPFGILGCEAPGDKQRNGAIIGAIVGGVIGNRVADDNRAMGTVIGAAVGGAAGSYIGCTLQRRDQERLAQDAERAVATGQSSTYANQESGINAATNVSSSTRSGTQNISLNSNVQAPPRLVLMGGRYSANRDVAIKSAPQTNSRTIGGLGASDEVDVLGRTTGNSPWAALESGGSVVGYVPLSALTSTGRVAATNQNAANNTRTVAVPVTSVCRDVRQTVTSTQNQESQSGNTAVCNQTDGSWKPL